MDEDGVMWGPGGFQRPGTLFGSPYTRVTVHYIAAHVGPLVYGTLMCGTWIFFLGTSDLESWVNPTGPRYLIMKDVDPQNHNIIYIYIWSASPDSSTIRFLDP